MLAVIRFQFYVDGGVDDGCIRVTSGDRLGLYFEEVPWALSYNFAAQSAPQTFFFRTSQPINVSDVIEFSVLSFPYRFSIAAYLDTG